MSALQHLGQHPEPNHRRSSGRLSRRQPPTASREAGARSEKPTLRVMVVTESFLPQVNGVTGSVCRVLEHLEQQGHEAVVVAATGPDEYAGATVEKVASLPMPVYDGFRLATPRRATLRDLVVRHRPDVIHLASPAVMGPRAAREAARLGVPVVGIYQTDLVGFASRYGLPGGERAMTRLTQHAHRYVDLNLAPSTAAVRQLVDLGIPRDRIRLWGRGVDAERFHPGRRDEGGGPAWAGPGHRVVGYMGRVAAEKEIELMASLQHLPDTTVVVVGDGPALRDVQRALPKAVFTGALSGDDLARAVASFDVFVHPGRHETFCQAVQEGLASGVPAVVAAAGGPLDLVVDGVTGAHFTPGDAADLRRAVEQLLDDADRRREMGHAARRSIEGRSWAALGDQLVDHYRDALAGTVAPAAASGSAAPTSAASIPVTTGERTTAPRVSVIGTGYLGATHAAAMAELGFETIGIDRDEEAVDVLSAGAAPFHEPGLDELLDAHTGSGRLSFSTVMADAVAADVHFICVGTPQARGGDVADLGALEGVIEALVPLLTHDALLVGKSTVPVGTARRLRARARELAPAGVAVDLVWNPEFLREGHGVVDSLRPDRLVLGCDSAAAERTMREVYAAPLADGVPLLVTDLETAELVKTAANAFLATKISFANLMGELCDASGGDVALLTHALGLDERIGPRFLGAGIGYGGGCLPKDVRALAARGEQLGADMTLLRAVDGVNDRARDRVLEAVIDQLDGVVEGARVALLGAAFKAGSDDVRSSPALAAAAALRRLGARVSVYDPEATQRARAAAPQLRYCANAYAACRKADVVLLATEWPEFARLDPDDLLRIVRAPRAVDGRQVIDADAWRRVGWQVVVPGRPVRGAAAALR